MRARLSVLLALALTISAQAGLISLKKRDAPEVVKAIVGPPAFNPGANCPCYNPYGTYSSPCACATQTTPEQIEQEAAAAPKKMVAHLDFKTIKGIVAIDNTEFANNAYLSEGSLVLKVKDGTCGNALRTWNGDILFHGDTFQEKPRYGVTVATWVKLEHVEGSHEIFDTIGESHNCGQYHFEVNDGNIRWFHRDETQRTIFNVDSFGNAIKPNVWFHVAGTYDAAVGKAKIYLNGELRNMTTGDGLLSIDWLRKAGIGDHKALRPLMGSVSDFRIYNYALPGVEIKKLVDECKGYIPKPPTKPPTKTKTTTSTKKKPFFDAVVPEPAAPVPPATVTPPQADELDTDLLDDDTEKDEDEETDDDIGGISDAEVEKAIAEAKAEDNLTSKEEKNDTLAKKLSKTEQTIEEAVLKRSHVNSIPNPKIEWV